MTIRERLTERLVENGLFPAQAEYVLTQAKDDPSLADMAARWNDDCDGYPAPLLAVLWVAIKAVALAYIDKECPRAWFRPMFAT